ncbi:MAG: ATP-binding protein [Actinobacteria bacterium]|nr:ATP-binding protein [Actinomycetota bacterium]
MIRSARLGAIKGRSIGKVANTVKALLHDVQSQCRTRARETIGHLEERRFQQLDESLGQASKYLGNIFAFLTRPEIRLAKQLLSLWDEIRQRMGSEIDKARVVSTPDDARVILNEFKGNLSQLLEFGEFALLDMCIPIQAQFLSHIKGEMERWGISAPAVEISAERIVYPFHGDTEQILLSIQNNGAVSIDSVVVLAVANTGISLSPECFEVRYLGPSDKVTQAVEVSIPPECLRLQINWFAEVVDGFGVENRGEGNMQLEVDRGTPWHEISNWPNPYPTDPIESPDRLYGRQDTLRNLMRVVKSGESRYLTGQRRVGKTSVARVLLESLNKQDFIPVYAPWGEIGGKIFEVVCWQLCNRLREEAVRTQPDLEAINLPTAEEFERGFNQATVGFIRRIRATSGRNIVIVLDDFDDVPEWVYSEETGDLFFSMLKTLTGSRGISLIFVGGQRLRSIMQSPVAGKLNQVTPVDLGYLPREAMPQLVREPTRGMLLFSEDSIDRIIYLSACNPFYANRICNRLWDFMIERKWKYVIAEDVERIANETVSHDDSPLFSHFWMDGIWGQGEIQEAFVNINRAILYALGRLGTLEPNSLYFHFNDIKRECRCLNEQQLQKWLADLVAREVVEMHQELPSQYAIRTPYFRLWLEKRGQSELYSKLDTSTILLLQKPEKEVVTDEELEDLVGQGIKYRSGVVGVYEVRKFLKQFGSANNQRLAYKLVEKLVREGFFNREDVQLAATAAVKALSQYATATITGFVKSLTDSGVWKNIFVVVPSGSSVTSFHALADFIRQEENLAKNQSGTSRDLIGFIRQQRTHVAVLLFDDVIGTGVTALAAIQEVLDALDTENLFGNVACIMFYAVVGFRDVVEELNLRLEGRAIVKAYRRLAEVNKAFNPDAGIFDTDEERERAQKLIESIGAKLEPRCPLGYGGLQALISFYRNTPNITLPIFYKASRKKDFPWWPLFRRM